MNPYLHQLQQRMNRRQFLTKTSMGLGALALSRLFGESQLNANSMLTSPGGLPGLPHFSPKVKRVVYLFMSGGPSQMDMWDYKPGLKNYHGQNLPDSVRKGQRLTGMSAGQSAIPVAASPFEFAQHGRNGTWVSELLPHTAKVVDELCIIKS
ncbi:MAG: DUF1501 domain-containing protein, partial [Bacteroidota bacterium]